jgi:ppGpp synthetase/RelA/SpoT-type nucleotidyltranferase
MARKKQKKGKALETDAKHDPWVSHPHLIRSFLEFRPRYEELCREVAYILRKRINSNEIEVSAVTYRAKTLSSFLKKNERKTYSAPFDEITDLAGVRVVCLYLPDIVAIEQIIREEFVVSEKVDKLTEKASDQFGYGAIHFVVKLGSASKGARYDDLKDLSCEIQVRTVLQDAWAIIDHHLVYKKESAVPKRLQRKLNSLAGLFETADDQFQRLREERGEYVQEVRESQNQPEQFLATEINFDSLKEYLLWKYPGEPTAASSAQLGSILETLQRAGLQELSDLEVAEENSWKEETEATLKELDATSEVDKSEGRIPSCAYHLTLLALTNQKVLNSLKNAGRP